MSSIPLEAGELVLLPAGEEKEAQAAGQGGGGHTGGLGGQSGTLFGMLYTNEKAQKVHGVC